jgi:3-phytase
MALLAVGASPQAAEAWREDPVVPVAITYDAAGSLDEDDMCVWVHPTDPALSTVIVADKFAGVVYVYALDGTLLHETLSPSPRNIDTRYGVRFDGGCVDVVAFNERIEEIIRIYKVDPVTRELVRIDDGNITTDRNYGFTLYRHYDGRLFAVTGNRTTGLMTQYLLFDNGLGQMTGAPTAWHFQEGTVEGMVGDDETGYLYLAEETVGIWRVHALDDTDKTLIATDGDASGLDGDLEGIAIYYAGEGEGYLVVSSQGASKYTLLQRKPPHQGAGNFRVDGVVLTDGMDVLNASLGPIFPEGIFLAHTGGHTCCSVKAARWDDIAAPLGLIVDTDSWDPRTPCDPLDNFVRFEEARTGGSLSSATVTTDQPLGAAPDDLYVAAVSTRPAVSVSSITGLGLTWSRLRSQCAGRNQTALEVWTAQGLPAAAGAVTASLAQAATSAAISVSRFSNVATDPIGEAISGNTRGSAGACSGGVDSSRYSFNVNTTVEGALVFGAASMRHRKHTPAPGYRERAERVASSGGSAASVATMDMAVWTPQPTALEGTFSGTVDWAVIGFEILPGAGAEPLPCPWDLDGSGDVALPDLVVLVNAWGTDPGGPPDFDGSGVVEFPDLMQLVTHWGPCP